MVEHVCEGAESMKQNVLGLQFDNVTMQEAIRCGEQFLEGDKPAVVVTPNAEIAYDAAQDPTFCELLNGADLREAAALLTVFLLLNMGVKE